MAKAIVGVIGGSGVYHLPDLTDMREKAVSTPWGDPSDALRFGRVGATDASFWPATAAATASRLRASTTAPTSTR